MATKEKKMLMSKARDILIKNGFSQFVPGSRYPNDGFRFAPEDEKYRDLNDSAKKLMGEDNFLLLGLYGTRRNSDNHFINNLIALKKWENALRKEGIHSFTYEYHPPKGAPYVFYLIIYS